MNKTEKVMLVTTLILALFSSIMLGAYLKAEQQNHLNQIINQRLNEDISRIKISLRIDVSDKEGRLKSSFYDDDDLILDQFIDFMAGVLTDPNGATTITITLTDTSNTARNCYIRCTTYAGMLFNTNNGASGGFIGIGTGTTTASRSDYYLQTPVESLTSVGTSPSYSDGNITLSAAVAVTADRTITEAAFLCQWGDISQTIRTFTLFRDVFAGISVTNGDTCTVTYTVNLSSTGFTDQFGEILEGVFTNVIQDGDTTQSLVDTGGAARTVQIYTDSVTNILFDGNIATPGSAIQVGTSSSAVGRANYTLGTAVESMIGNSVPVISGTSNITTASVITMTADRTITEAGFFLRGDDTAGTDRLFMLWRTTFEGVAVSSGNTITITYIIILIVIPLDFFKKREEYRF